jgi:hypothetical protein
MGVRNWAIAVEPGFSDGITGEVKRAEVCFG